MARYKGISNLLEVFPFWSEMRPPLSTTEQKSELLGGLHEMTDCDPNEGFQALRDDGLNQTAWWIATKAESSSRVARLLRFLDTLP